MAFLDDILAAKRAAISRHQTSLPPAEVRSRAEAPPPPLDFAAALRGDQVRVVAEVKRASPSKGDLDTDLDAPDQALLYAENGAAVVSVLCEEDYFKGSLDDLRTARDAIHAAGHDLPVLCKDFIVDLYQVWQARTFEADSLLLIMTMVEVGLARELLDAARSVGMEPLVEVHDQADLDQAIAIGARVIGINNRDLRTFKTDVGVTAELAGGVPAGVALLSESGLATADDVRRVAGYGVDAVLVGEAIVTSADPAATLRALTEVRHVFHV